MANSLVNGRLVASAMIGGLVDAGVLINTVYRDPESAFVAGKGDTVSVRRLSTRAASNFSGTATASDVTEADVQVTLSHQPYVQVALSAKEKTLKTEDFYRQVVKPNVDGVAEYLEDVIADTLAGTATTGVRGTTAKKALIAAKKALDVAKVPQTDRYFAMSPLFTSTLLDESWVVASDLGDGGLALREAIIGRAFGFTLVQSTFIVDIDSGDTAAGVDATGYAYHRTGVAFASRTPAAPEGGAVSGTASAMGFGARMVMGWDNASLADVVTVDTLAGATRSHDARIVPVAIALD